MVLGAVPTGLFYQPGYERSSFRMRRHVDQLYFPWSASPAATSERTIRTWTRTANVWTMDRRFIQPSVLLTWIAWTRLFRLRNTESASVREFRFSGHERLNGRPESDTHGSSRIICISAVHSYYPMVPCSPLRWYLIVVHPPTPSVHDENRPDPRPHSSKRTARCARRPRTA